MYHKITDEFCSHNYSFWRPVLGEMFPFTVCSLMSDSKIFTGTSIVNGLHSVSELENKDLTSSFLLLKAVLNALSIH